ncbi:MULTISPECIES: Sec-independent protein translocase protein TatB [Rhizobium]|uniref:Sec-independent protein translocase protein TatB n=1 Tax=Rhizobium tropici TaxID=398 RepID=A0A6P1C893_RHITR|nr:MULTISPECIES: Sec-independent protein translocase protein TatB [Rhizobium]AGB70981.1 Sec-independent protein translocase TatB [Rhizobium tropici CIAT 899]MBB4242426.1 sec-independent protein translocase protein TatB [Rhizobium tropici]MBB5594069.1 sec-independent protein translocase protein TatB [Rhizobium tropici]MBB6492810.1 sec-independent protein translocase protein TatB [Rhizobium tropici]NEV11783.1 twin-arginine translocase subunit TatB [Rhizobium tropici]
MFDIGWSELVVIGVVALVVIGPKELPSTLRTIGKMTARARKVAGDFRAQFDEAMREADLDDVRQTIADAQKLNPVNSLREAMNPLREMGNEIKADLQRTATPDKAAPAATPLPSEPVPGVTSGLPEALAASSPTSAASSNPSPAAAPAAAVVPQPLAAASETSEKPKAVRKPRSKAVTKFDEVAAAAVQTPIVTEKPKRAPRKVATAVAVEKAPPAPRKRAAATASKATPKTPKKKDQA